MDTIIQNQSLKSFNTFGIEAKAAYFGNFTHVDSLLQMLEFAQIKQLPILVLGGGSNILFLNDFNGLVLRNCTKGIQYTSTGNAQQTVTAAGGEVWHELVLDTLKHNLGGLENLSLIPGSVGASPIQNIGAYGVEIKDIFAELSALEIATGTIRTFTGHDCKFGYRESFFKREGKGKYIILSVSYKLTSDGELQTHYGSISDELKKINVPASIHSISQAVCNIRSGKLPNPAVLGNAGSFFKNPTISEQAFQTLKQQYPNLPGYDVMPGQKKTAAGFLIEQCGLKGYREGQAGVHQHQALVLVNYGGATGRDILNLSSHVIEAVYQKFGITLEREVNVI